MQGNGDDDDSNNNNHREPVPQNILVLHARKSMHAVSSVFECTLHALRAVVDASHNTHNTIVVVDAPHKINDQNKKACALSSLLRPPSVSPRIAPSRSLAHKHTPATYSPVRHSTHLRQRELRAHIGGDRRRPPAREFPNSTFSFSSNVEQIGSICCLRAALNGRCVCCFLVRLC